MAECADLEEVWMVISPLNPLKSQESLLADNNRLKLVQLAVGDYKKIKVSNVEFDLPKPSFTFHTLNFLKQKYPQNKFVIIIGSDNLEIFKTWKNYEEILSGYELYVYPRLSDYQGQLKKHPNVKLINAPVMEISATFIRKCIKEKKDIRFMLPEKVYSYISEKHFYE
jgi:nicotinate-nucleotide adenylyltransferase